MHVEGPARGQRHRRGCGAHRIRHPVKSAQGETQAQQTGASMSPSWTVERVDLLKKLGVTRSATLGKVHRLKLMARKPATSNPPKLPPAAVDRGIAGSVTHKINAARRAKAT